MGFKDQLHMLKQNWLMWVIIVVLFIVLYSFFGLFGATSSQKMVESGGYAMDESLGYDGYAENTRYYPSPSGDFAPEVEDRKITKTSSLSTEVEKGTFPSAHDQLVSIVSSSDSYLLNNNVRKYEVGSTEYSQGSYTIKVDTSKYDAVVSQLKQIGDVQSFNEQATDITGAYTNTKIEIASEQARLDRYEELYAASSDVEDKLTLTDRIFEQERRITYLQDRLDNLDSRVDYSSVTVTISEKQSDYASVVFVKLSDLVKTFIGSVKAILYFLFAIVPWIVLIGLIVWLVKWLQRRRSA